MHCAYRDLPPAPHPDSGPTRGAELINKANFPFSPFSPYHTAAHFMEQQDSPSDLAHLWVVRLDMNLSNTLRGRWMCGLFNWHHVLYWCLLWTTIYCSVFLSLKQHFAASKGGCNTLVCWSQSHLNIPMFKSHTWGWGVVAVAYFGLLCDRYSWRSWISTLTLWLFSTCGIVAPHLSIHLCQGNVTCGLSCCKSYFKWGSNSNRSLHYFCRGIFTVTQTKPSETCCMPAAHEVFTRLMKPTCSCHWKMSRKTVVK